MFSHLGVINEVQSSIPLVWSVSPLWMLRWVV